jgi:hypothetical protein
MGKLVVFEEAGAVALPSAAADAQAARADEE